MISYTSNDWLMAVLYLFLENLSLFLCQGLNYKEIQWTPFSMFHLSIIFWKKKNCVQFTITGNDPSGWTEWKCENPIWNQNNNNTAFMQGLHLLKEFSPCIKRVFRVFSRHVRLVNSGSTTQKIFLLIIQM